MDATDSAISTHITHSAPNMENEVKSLISEIECMLGPSERPTSQASRLTGSWAMVRPRCRRVTSLCQHRRFTVWRAEYCDRRAAASQNRGKCNNLAANVSAARQISANRNQINHEYKGLVRTYVLPGATRSVGLVGRYSQTAASSDLHSNQSTVPAIDHLVLTELESEGLAAFPGRIELPAC